VTPKTDMEIHWGLSVMFSNFGQAAGENRMTEQSFRWGKQCKSGAGGATGSRAMNKACPLVL